MHNFEEIDVYGNSIGSSNNKISIADLLSTKELLSIFLIVFENEKDKGNQFITQLKSVLFLFLQKKLLLTLIIKILIYHVKNILILI